MAQHKEYHNIFEEFVSQFCDPSVLKGNIHYIQKKVFLLQENTESFKDLARISQIGTYLGKIEKKTFEASLALLQIIGNHTSKKITIDAKSSWLFVCGKDIFESSVLDIDKHCQDNAKVFVVNKAGETLGIAKYVSKGIKQFGKKNEPIVLKNILDIGHYLRAET